MYIADAGNYRVQKWLPNQPLGFIVAGGRGNGAALNQIGFSYSIFIDNLGNIYVSESTNHRVTLWLPYNETAGQLVISFHYMCERFHIFVLRLPVSVLLEMHRLN